MPGILPMKVIKVGTSSQSRIAQACDRCRSKKIRCDGIRPCCSQCSTVGFECRTSDKLSRRAFPRGYTETLEERVRQLETEVHELKDLLDEKDEKIDMLSRLMQGARQRQSQEAATQSNDSLSNRNTKPSAVSSPVAKGDTFRVQASPLLLGVENSDSYFMGLSSGRGLLEAMKRKMQECGKPCTDFNPDTLIHTQGCSPLTTAVPDKSLRIPPRLLTDRCVNVYFQEWAPLFPILHKPTFLLSYGNFVSDPEKIKSKHKSAQLYLVFGIAAVSGELADADQLMAIEAQWRHDLDAVITENTIDTLQCLLMALTYCAIRADYTLLQHYKSIAVGLSHRLGLHQSQKRFSFGALTTETRKRTFWTLYTLDCLPVYSSFSAAVLGLPRLLRDDDINTEYPVDVDDEYVTEKGFQPTLPGEHTKLSNALALFRLSRVFARILDKIYPASVSTELSLQQMSALEAELNEWSVGLPAHLKLNFVQDKPATDVTGSRSPLLALVYYYAKTLVYRPAIGSTLGTKSASAVMSVSDSSKRIVQILQLLDERNMVFSLSLNKTDVLVLCGMALLYQTLELSPKSKILRDNERSIKAIMEVLDKSKTNGAFQFRRITAHLLLSDSVSLSSPAKPSSKGILGTSNRKSSISRINNDKATLNSGKQVEGSQYGVMESSSFSSCSKKEGPRRMTMPEESGRPNRDDFRASLARSSVDRFLGPSRPESIPENAISPQQWSSSNLIETTSAVGRPQSKRGCLDTRPSPSASLPIAGSPRCTQVQSVKNEPLQQLGELQPFELSQKALNVSAAEWETLLGSLDGGLDSVYETVYGGSGLSATVRMATMAAASAVVTAPAVSTTMAETPVSSSISGASDWSPTPWDLNDFNIADIVGSTEPSLSQSIPSMSEGSYSPGEDVSPSEINFCLGAMVDEYGSSPSQLDMSRAGAAPVDFRFDEFEGVFPI